MSRPTLPHVTALYRYPVKGLSPERLESVALSQGETVPGDRAWAIENGPGRFQSEAPKHLPKVHFLMLMRNERLATLTCHLDEATQTLTISRAGRQVARGQLSTSIGRSMIEQFLAAYMKAELRGAPKIVSAPGHSFSDVATKCLHIVNLASLREVERVMGRRLDPLRFRPNVVIDGVRPWAEFGWLGRDLSVGGRGGRAVRLSVFDRTTRCDATNVDPETGERDAAIPAALQRAFGHSDFGVYARVTTGGTIDQGAAIEIATT